MSNLGGKRMSEDTDKDNQASGVVETIVAGSRISVNSSDPANPIVTADVQAGGQVDSVVSGTNCSVDATDPVNPIVNADTQNNAKVTTKGDLEGFSTVAARIPVGTNAQVLTADSAETLGLKWATPAAGGGDVATDTIWDAKGDVAGGTGADTSARLAVGTNGQVLTADSAETTGMKWTTPSGGSATFHGALVEEETDTARSNSIYFATFDAEDYDTDAFADLGTNNDRITVPSGVTKVQVSYSFEGTGMGAVSNQLIEIVHYNSANAVQHEYGQVQASNYGNPNLAGTSPVISVATGDYFKLQILHSDTSWTQQYVSLGLEYKDGTL